MNAFSIYLLKSAIWLTVFAAVYLLLLRNERFFELNRIFLVSGIIAAIVFPLVTFTYKVSLTLPSETPSGENLAATVLPLRGGMAMPGLEAILICLYLAGLLIVAFVITRQGSSLLRVIRKAGIQPSGDVKLIRASEYHSSFSFFSYVFVNPSVSDIEMKEIMNHELVHIRQRHWFDLMLVESLCVL